MNGMYVLKDSKWLELGPLRVDADTGDCETAGPFGVSEAEMVCEQSKFFQPSRFKSLS
jgi:hypothetical protein